MRKYWTWLCAGWLIIAACAASVPMGDYLRAKRYGFLAPNAHTVWPQIIAREWAIVAVIAGVGVVCALKPGRFWAAIVGVAGLLLLAAVILLAFVPCHQCGPSAQYQLFLLAGLTVSSGSLVMAVQGLRTVGSAG